MPSRSDTRSQSDSGYFPRGSSMLRRVHEHRAVGLLYGQRALCIGALMPLNYVGTSEHSSARLTPFRRLAHTGKAFETIYFGTRVEADEVLAYVRHLHERVEGTLPEDAGITPAGTPYSALDPALMLWTVTVIADSVEFYELFVGRLSDTEREALWQDYVRFGELFGMPRDQVPSTYGEFRAYWAQRLASDERHLTDEARYIGHATAFQIPMPLANQPGKRVHDLIMLGSLPPRVASSTACPSAPPRPPPTPPPCGPSGPRSHLPRGPSGAAATRVPSRSVARTEQRRIGQRPADAAGRGLSELLLEHADRPWRPAHHLEPADLRHRRLQAGLEHRVHDHHEPRLLRRGPFWTTDLTDTWWRASSCATLGEHTRFVGDLQVEVERGDDVVDDLELPASSAASRPAGSSR